MGWGAGRFGKHKVELVPGSVSSKLITDGPFAFSRNPMYLGMVLVMLGIAVLLGSVSGFFGVVVFFLILRFGFISWEEGLMVKRFGGRYLDYRKKVGRWV